MTAAVIVWYVFLSLFCLGVLLFLMLGLKYICCFHRKKCPHCGKTMEYKGLREGETGWHYLFHCLHCGKWVQIYKKGIKTCGDGETCNT